MPAEVYEIAALAARFWFLFLMVMIVWHSYRWYARDRRLRKKRLRDLPDAGYIGEFVVMESTGDLKQGDVLPVPFEGTLGLLRNNDVCVEAEGVAQRHLWFRYDRERGIRMLPLDGNRFTVDQTPVDGQPEGLYVVHGSRLYVGQCQLRLRMFEGYEVKQAPQPASHARQGSPWPDQLMGAPVYAAPQPAGEYVCAPADPAPRQADQPEGLLPDRWRENPYAQPAPQEPSPYGQRVRSRFTASRSRQQDAIAAAADGNNPFRKRSSIPGLSGAGRVYRSMSGPPVQGAQQEPEKTIAEETAAPQPAPVQPEPSAAEPAAAENSFSAMSVYARMMAQTAKPQPAAPIGSEAKPATPVGTPTGSEAKPAAAHTAQMPKQAKPAAAKPQPAPARPKKPLPPTVRPVSLEGVSIMPTFAPAAQPDMVFEEPVPEAASLQPEEVFHPLMDEDDWEEWEGEPLPEEQPDPPSAPVQAAAVQSADQPEEEWPYLARPDGWQSEGLFADLLDEDGTDAASPLNTYTADHEAGNTTRRMLSRYFRGGGM